MCGGTDLTLLRPPRVIGLSPRVRGNLAMLRRAAQCDRSIPACAGEPGMCRAGPPTQKVYPRVCGGT